MEKLISYINHLHPVSEKLETELKNRFRFTTRKKYEMLLYEGTICSFAWYLQKGLIRCYYNRDAREITTWFLDENNPAVLLKSIFHQTKSRFNLQALEDCELYSIHYLDILALYHQFPEAIHLFHIIVDNYSNLNDLKIQATGILKARDRYRFFEQNFPHLLNRISLEFIASYLDIDVRTLTRVRKNK